VLVCAVSVLSFQEALLHRMKIWFQRWQALCKTYADLQTSLQLSACGLN